MSRKPAPRREETTVRLEDIAQQLSRLAQRERESATIMPYEAPRAPHEDSAALNRIIDRIDGNERQTVEAFTAVNERLSVLGRQIAMAPRTPAYEKPEDVPGFSALETAIRNVVEHLELSDKRTRESLRAMQDRLAEMTQRAIHTDAEDVLRTAPAFTALEARMSGLVERLERSEAQQQALPDVVRAELNQLADRIEAVRSAAAGETERVQTAAVIAAQNELRDIEGRILGAAQGSAGHAGEPVRHGRRSAAAARRDRFDSTGTSTSAAPAWRAMTMSTRCAWRWSSSLPGWRRARTCGPWPTWTGGSPN